MTPEYRQRFLAARWRIKNGLEHRTLVSLFYAPDVLDAARSVLKPADFLTPAYAALAARLLESSAGESKCALALSAIESRP